MAIDYSLSTDTDRLAYPEKTFLPVKIPVSHWQLRHYISAPDKESLYYASGKEVYYLNTVTRKRKHIADLPFDARCTASGFGWVCVAGEDDGHFAMLKIEHPSSSSSLRHTIDVDEPLPIEEYWTSPPPRAPRAEAVKVERIGEDIVNSISIHQIHDEEAHLYDVVAVLTNNDKTVRVYSLAHGIETTVLSLSFPMNHASLSPDGKTLVAVGDSNQAFFYTRTLDQNPPQIPKPHNRLNMSHVSWELSHHAHLKADQVSTRDIPAGYFTTAWSPNGSLVAVGSEGGHISVFDTALFEYCAKEEGEDAIVATIQSTRPNVPNSPCPGAVRTMLFSLEPWDLLIWAEDQGRVCIADLRTGLRTKQIIELKSDDENVKTVELEDLPEDGPSLEEDSSARLDQLEQEYLQQFGEDFGAGSFASELFRARERLQERERLRMQFPTLAEAAAIEDDPRGLTAHEQQILESLRTTRQREEARAQGLPRSINYTAPGMFGSGSASNNRSTHSPRPFSDVLVNHNDPHAGFPELSRTSQRNQDRLGDDTLPPLHSIQEYLALRDHERETRERLALPAPNSNLTSTSESSIRRRASATATASALPPHATRASNNTGETGEDEENPWRTISAAMNLARGPLFESPRSATLDTGTTGTTAARSTSRIQEALNRTDQLRRFAQQRDRLRGLRRDIDAGREEAGERIYESINALRGITRQRTTEGTSFGDGFGLYLGRRGREQLGVRTAGLAMSGDGRTLWCACEEGIFEVQINVKARMVFPAIDMA